MGKNSEKTGLGRALVKHHNQVIQQSKDKGRFYKNQQKKFLESITEVADIEAVIEQAEESQLLYSEDNPPVNLPIDLDSSSSTTWMESEERRHEQKQEEALHASSLRVPRRPPWNSKMSVEELDVNERQAFLIWRRNLASLEENEKLVLTPFEKNLDIWRQLWRVVERSDLLVMVVDARDPLFYRCPDLEVYAREIDQYKRTVLLINKADLVPISIREKWVKYFHDNGILFVFWSAKAASAALEGKKPVIMQESVDADTKICNRGQLLLRLQYEAEEAVSMKMKSGTSHDEPSIDLNGTSAQSKSVTVGFVGYPNVGKSSTINALVGEKRTGVTSTPGKTKHFQTLIISEKLTLCDCPGLVFPSFTSSRYEMIASGVLPIDRMTEQRQAVQVVANKVPRHVIEGVYKISLPKPKPYEPQSRPPLASELLRAYCLSRGYVASSGLPDETKASRNVLKDYIDGKLPHFEMPPGLTENSTKAAFLTGLPNMHESDLSEEAAPDDETDDGAPSLEHVINDLNSFEIAHGLASSKENVKKKSSGPSHKQHKKPQKKKDRSWRVRDMEGDGMPMVRVFQKPANTGPMRA